MNKKDFWTLLLFNIPTALLAIEHWCGLELAFEFMLGWTLISLIAHICVLSKYAKIVVIEEEYID